MKEEEVAFLNGTLKETVTGYEKAIETLEVIIFYFAVLILLYLPNSALFQIFSSLMAQR